MDKNPSTRSVGTLNAVGGRLKKVDQQIWVVLSLTVLIFAGMSIAIPHYASLYNVKTMINNYALEGIMALGMTLVIISGGIDLSIAGVMPFCAILFAFMIKGGIPYPLAMVFVLLAAAVIGFLNDLLIRKLEVHPFVITLAMQLILKGINVVITSGDVVSGFPEDFSSIMFNEYWGMSIPLLTLIVLAAFYAVMLRKNRYFRQVYFVGGNPNAAELSGINTGRFFRFVYMQSALLAGVAGIMACFFYGSANASYGLNIETRVITAVAIGGSSMIHGGIGSIGGTILGLIFVASINGSFIMSGLSTYYQDVIIGVLLVFAVVFSERLKGIKRKHPRKAKTESSRRKVK